MFAGMTLFAVGALSPPELSIMVGLSVCLSSTLEKRGEAQIY